LIRLVFRPVVRPTLPISIARCTGMMAPHKIDIKSEHDSRPPTAKTMFDLDEEKRVDAPSDGKEPVSADSPGGNAFSIPDGGWRAWSVVFGCALVLFSTFGYVSFISSNFKAGSPLNGW
jgi:hypothetical protein